MRLVDYIKNEYQEFTLTSEKLFEWYQNRYLFISDENVPDNLIEFSEYEIQPNTNISLFMCFKRYKPDSNIEYYNMDILDKNISKISGLGKKGLESMYKVLGDTFTIDKLKNEYKNIDNVGKKTLANIVEFLEGS